MNKVQQQSYPTGPISHSGSAGGLPSGIQKVTHRAKESDEVLNAIIRDVLQTREVRQLITTIVPEFLNVWAGRSWWKKTVSRLAGFVVDNQLSRPEDVFENNEIAALFEDEKFIRNIGEQLPDIINGLADALLSSAKNLENFTPEDKTQLLEDLLSRTGKGRTGALLTSCARVLNDIHKVDSEFLAHTLEPGIKKWLESTDFGEIKEAVDGSGQGALALARMINNVIWEYPSKVIGIFSLLPSIVNMVAGVTEISVEKLNAVPPDLLTDIIISLVKEIDGKAVAGVADELTEISRKLHIGSALLGEPGAPQLPKALADKVDEIVSQTDATVFWKGRIALAEIKASVDEALADAVNNNPEYARLGMIHGPELYNLGIRTRNRKMSLLDSLDDEELGTSLAQCLSSYDVQGTAEVFNNFLRLANRLWEQKPGACAEFISQFMNAVDTDEMAEAARNVLGEMREELRPIARSVVPGLVELACDALQPEDDENEDDATRARDALRALLMAEEV